MTDKSDPMTVEGMEEGTDRVMSATTVYMGALIGLDMMTLVTAADIPLSDMVLISAVGAVVFAAIDSAWGRYGW